MLMMLLNSRKFNGAYGSETLTETEESHDGFSLKPPQTPHYGLSVSKWLSLTMSLLQEETAASNSNMFKCKNVHFDRSVL